MITQVIPDDVTPTHTVKISTVKTDKYYGIMIGGLKGFVTQEAYKHGQFRLINAGEDITFGNNWSAKSNTLTGLIEHLLCMGFQVYQFDTHHELFKWLADQ